MKVIDLKTEKAKFDKLQKQILFSNDREEEQIRMMQILNWSGQLKTKKLELR